MAMNENEIERIAAATNALRPDWPLASLRTLLNRPEIINRPRRDVAVAMAWVACERETKTPARVISAGPWWQATNADGSRVRTSYNQPCPFHDGEILPCGRCAAARVPAEESKALALLRAELQVTRANLCPCGVKPTACGAHDPRRQGERADQIEGSWEPCAEGVGGRIWAPSHRADLARRRETDTREMTEESHD